MFAKSASSHKLLAVNNGSDMIMYVHSSVCMYSIDIPSIFNIFTNRGYHYGHESGLCESS